LAETWSISYLHQNTAASCFDCGASDNSKQFLHSSVEDSCSAFVFDHMSDTDIFIYLITAVKHILFYTLIKVSCILEEKSMAVVNETEPDVLTVMMPS